jgi:hypothetical protein
MTFRTDLHEPDAQRLLQEADLALSSISRFLNLPIPQSAIPNSHSLQVLAFRSPWGMRAYLAEHCPRLAGRAAACFEGPAGYTITVSGRSGRDETSHLLRHELTHYLLASNFDDFPPWVDEGLAQFFEPGEPFGRVNPLVLKDLQAAVRRPGSGVLEELVALPPGRALSRRQYALAWGLVFYLAGEPRLGRPAILGYLKTVRSDRPAADCFREAFRLRPGDLEPAWRAFVGRLSADDDPQRSRA